MRWIVRRIEAGTELPAVETISAVFLVALRGGSILAVRNERGWDIPGGHVEPGETLASALSREVLEEAAATLSSSVQPIAAVQTAGRLDVMLVYTVEAFELLPFTPGVDALERTVMPVDRFADVYCGPVDVLRQLLDAAMAVFRTHPGTQD